MKSIKVTVMRKKGRQFFEDKMGVTPSVIAAPGVTHPSDATEKFIEKLKCTSV